MQFGVNDDGSSEMLSLDLSGHIALVTGAEGGLGNQIAIDLAECGANIVLTDRTAGAPAQALATQIRSSTGRDVYVVVGDISSPDDVRQMASSLRNVLDRPVTVLVNNAGHYRDYAPIFQVSDEVIDRTIDTNLKGTMYVTREFTKWMIEAGVGGRVINIGSGAGRSGRWRHAHYCGSKAGVLGATKAMAIDLAEYGITANSITVGFVDVGKFDEGDLATVKNDIIPRILLRRAGEPRSVSAMVCYLASRHAAWITGTDVVIDGGESAGRIPIG